MLKIVPPPERFVQASDQHISQNEIQFDMSCARCAGRLECAARETYPIPQKKGSSRVKKHISHVCAAGAVFLSRALFLSVFFSFPLYVYLCAKIEELCGALLFAQFTAAERHVKWRINSAFAHLQIMGASGRRREERNRFFYSRVLRSSRPALYTPRSFNRT